MSFDLYLRDPETGETAVVPDGHDLRGGTHAIGGTGEAWLNVTYNYAERFYRVFGDVGIRSLNGMTGRKSVGVLDSAISKLGTDTDPNYWKSTDGNARRALEDLRMLARSCPNAIWEVR